MPMANRSRAISAFAILFEEHVLMGKLTSFTQKI